MRSFGLIFGVTTDAVSVTLVTFMGGLAIGSWIVSRVPVRRIVPAYAAVEAAIGASALLTLPVLRALPVWYGGALGGGALHGGMASGLRLAAAAAVVLLPTLLLGATFPLLVEALARARRDFHASLGRLYLVNTLGGATGVVLGAFVILPALGVTAAFLVAALANLAVGVAAVLAGRGFDAAPAPGENRPGGAAAPESAAREAAGAARAAAGAVPAAPWMFIVAAAATGACSFGLEILWTRSLAQVIGSSIYSFNLMLVAFLLGIVLGTAIYDRVRTRVARPAAWLAALLAGTGLLILADVAIVGMLPLVYFNLMRALPVAFAAHQAAGFALCLLAMLPITTAFGMSFPLLVHLVTMEGRTPQQVSGRLYAWNTLGAIAGALVTSFVLVPAAGLQASYTAMAALVLAAGALAQGVDRDWSRVTRAGAAAVALAATLALGLAWHPWDLNLMTAGVYKYGPGWLKEAGPGFFWLRDGLRSGRELLFYEEGRETVVAVVRTGVDNSILVNGKTDGGTSRWDSATQKLLAHVPLVLHPAPGRVLVIGWGTGGTAGAAALHPVTDLHVVEIEPAVFRAAPFFAEVNRGVERDPRFRLTIEDARTVLIADPARYDVIISEPSNPWISGVSNLFTADFYRIALPRLEADGIFCQWFHYYNMTPDDIRMQARTFTAVFPNATMWVVPPTPPEDGVPSLSGDMLLIGSRAPIVLDAGRVRERLADAGVAASLAGAGVRDAADLLLDQVMDDHDLRAFGGDGPLNTDDRPAIEFSAPRGLFLSTEANAAMYALFEAGAGTAVPPIVGEPGIAGTAGGAAGGAPDGTAAAAPMDPRGRAEAYARLASTLARKAMPQRATRLLQEALALDPRSGPAHAALGEILYVGGQRDEGVRLLAQALEEDPAQETPYTILGFHAYGARDLETARRLFDALVERFPGQATGYYGQALLDVEARDWTRARERVGRALALQPGFDQARQLGTFIDRQAGAGN